MRHSLAPTWLLSLILAATVILSGPAWSQSAVPMCGAEQTVALVPTDLEQCEKLGKVIRQPSKLRLDEYETVFGDFLRAFCHRNEEAGWKRDKFVRDTGPFTANLANQVWTGADRGTHAPVVIWYSPEMLEWMADNRPAEESEAPDSPPPVPDGAVMIKEMYPAPAADCAKIDPIYLLPTSGAAVMVRDREASHDGWFWGWFGWSGWDPDWPASVENRLPYMGFGQYCVNCHGSAQDNLTFASLRNVEGEPGEPLVFLSQHFYDVAPVPSHHREVSLPTDDAPRLGQPHYSYSSAFTEGIPATSLPRPTWESVVPMASETYDNVWVEAGGPTAASQFVTSDQCLGCHDAGSTGLQFDMTQPNPHGDNLLNFSPYATWKTSPMGLGGRDPIFFAQLASETETFHPKAAAIIQDTCLGCHGIVGQRQFAIDRNPKEDDCRCLSGESDEDCFLRVYVNAIPYPGGDVQSEFANFGALARDGISCTACHHMLAGQGDGPALREPENRCVAERQAFLNPGNTGFAKTFTGSFLVGPPGELYGPFEDPKVKPMEHALGIQPVHNSAIQSSELCGSCHTVHLPVMDDDDEIIAYTYEQTTYSEWAMSAYRTGTTPQGDLPEGPGQLSESCQSCHMPSVDEAGDPVLSKIASIQEFTNFPQSEYNLGPEDIDLAIRTGFARHTLVGLNVFLIKMAQQFPDVLGLRTQDPMLVSKGLDPLLLTEQAMLDQASTGTATVEIGKMERHKMQKGKRGNGPEVLRVPVTVASKVGHKLPSGVGFRRAFLTFEVLDALGNTIWASGRSNDAGLLVDEQGEPLPGELWWQDDCSARRHPDKLVYQPHYQKIQHQDQVQIYQELVTSPADTAKPECGKHATPGGEFTTSFLSICGHVKDNRILPDGFLPLEKRIAIAKALGAGEDLAYDTGPTAVGNDPDYRSGGKDSLVYEIPLAGLSAPPANVRATLNYQATPPFYLQDRFCTSNSKDTQRLFFLAGHLNLNGTEAEGWKLEVVGSGTVPVPGGG